jgi:GAF domain-containing protein
VKKNAYLISHIIFLSGVFAASLLLYRLLGDAYAGMKQKTEELKILQAEIIGKKMLLEKYQQTLLTLTRKEATLTGSVDGIMQAVCLTAAKTLEISHVGVWFFGAEERVLTRKFQCTPRGIVAAEISIHREEYPTYFEALQTQPFIMATDAATHAATREFATNYIQQDRILSMLDCPILLDGEVLGVISCEQQHEPREWQLEDALFVQSLADFIAIGTQNERIKKLLHQIRQQNFDLVEKNHEIGALNEELTSANDQLADLNKNLEDAVRKRTRELEFQNQQLTEYAFINSHLLRAPLARILGLAQVITREVGTVREKELLVALEQSAHELDQIIRKISELLYAGNNFSRENINEIIQRNFDSKL